MEFRKILVLSPHADDSELGAGGTIARFIEEGREVHYVVFSSCEESVPACFPRDILRDECRRSTSTLGILPDNLCLLDYKVRTFPEHRQEILENMVQFKNMFEPNLVLVPSSHDSHQDHQTIYWEALRAFKKEASIWGYEHPWNNFDFTTDVFVTLNQGHLDKKIRALKEYESQSNKSYFNEVYIRSLVYTRGMQLDLQHAETFELIRLVF